MFGNIGGSVDFMIILFIIFFNWMENINQRTRVRKILTKTLNIAPGLLKEKKRIRRGFCCWKKALTAAEQKDDDAKVEPTDIVDEVAEHSLAMEEIARNSIFVNYILSKTTDESINKLAPSIMVMEKMLEERR